MSYLRNLQRHAAMEYGEVRSVMPLKPGVGDHTPERFADHEPRRNANHPSLLGVKAENVDTTAEQLWQRIVRENPRASDKEIEYLFLGAVIDLFKHMRKRLSN